MPNGQQDKPIQHVNIPLTGRLRTAVDGTQLAEGDFQVLKNMRYGEMSPKSVSGMTKVNSSVINSTYIKPRAGFHFMKTQPSETHIFVQSFNSALTASRVYDNTNAVGSLGNFTTDPIWTDTSSGQVGAFSKAPDGCMAYGNGTDTCVWGGNEYRCAGFLLKDSTDAYLYDYTEGVNNTLTDSLNIAVLAVDPAYVYIGSTRPIKGVKFYVSVLNTNAASVAVSYWANSTWTSVSTLVDGTLDAGGTKTLAPVSGYGSITFASTVATAKPRILNNVFAYWYRFVFTGISTTTAIYYVTVDAPFQSVVDLWDGKPRSIMSYYRYVSTYTEETIQVLEEDYLSGDNLTYSDISALGTSNYIVCGFSERMTGIDFTLVTGKANTNTATMTIYYWNGSAWTTVGTINDATSQGGKSLSKSGAVTWDAPAKSIEFRNSISAQELWYYYKISFNATLSANVYLDYVTGIPAQKSIHGYSYPVMWQNRLWLLDEKAGKRNSIICSSQDTVCVFNGDDSISPDAPKTFGNEDGITGGATLFTRFGGSLYDNLVITKMGEVWLVDGTTPSDYKFYKIADNYGCVASATLKACDLGYEIAPGLLKHILIWQSENAIVIFDGNAVNPISDDIKNYFDTLKSECIPISMLSKSSSFYDNSEYEYHWLFASGSGATTLNKEFVYHILKKKWYEVDRSTGKYLQIGFSAKATNGKDYTYGGIDTGYIERLEFGNTFDGTGITSQFRIGDIPLGGWQYQSKVRRLKHIAISKSSTTNSVTISHYGNASNTASTYTVTHAVKNTTHRITQKVDGIDWGDYTFHSIACSLTTDNESVGYEPIGLNISYQIIRDDILDKDTPVSDILAETGENIIVE